MSKSVIHYLGHTNSPDLTITYSINGRRYDYLFHHRDTMETALYLIRRVSPGKALAYTKKRAALLEPAQ